MRKVQQIELKELLFVTNRPECNHLGIKLAIFISGSIRVKRTVSAHCNIRIPKIKVKQGYQNPWFDSEAHDACRNKDRLQAKYKQNRTTENYVKFSDARRSYGKLCDKN